MAERGVVMGHPTLNANTRVAADALATAGLLGEFHTLLDTSRLSPRLPARLRMQLGRRDLPLGVQPYVRSHPALEVARLLARRATRSAAIDKRLVDLIYARLDFALAHAVNSDTTAVYAYEDSARRAFERAEQLGVPRIYDLPIGYWRAGQAILREEAELQPEWAGTLDALADRERKLADKDVELSKADTVLVASSFTQRTLASFPGDIPEVRVLPYGAPQAIEEVRESTGGAVRVLFVGGLSQRKGLSYFFEALELSDVPVRATVVGMRAGESDRLDAELARSWVTWYPTLPHSAVLRVMRESDVLVFPSLFEGFGLVITEALSQGLPVIATENTAGPDVLTHDVDGWIVPIRSSQAIAERIVALADVDRRNEAKHAAVRKARSLTWDSYRSGVVAAVRACG